MAEEQIVQGNVLAMATYHTLLLGLESTLLLGLVVAWKYIFQAQVNFVWARYKSLYIYINAMYVNKNQQQCWSPGLSFIIHKWEGLLLLHGLIVASLRINQINIKTDKVKLKPYLHQNHSIG